MALFSQRKGSKPVRETVQFENMDESLRNALWNGELHACLKAGFSKFYAYTSDKGGIRHAVLDEPNLTKADALFFLVTCSAFINYLKSKVTSVRLLVEQ